MKYIGTYSNDTDIATKAKVDAKQDKVLVDGILQGDGAGTISAAETQEVELVELTEVDVGLGNVDNTSDADKPISTATQTALNGKQATITGGATTITSNNLTANRALISNASGKVAVSGVTDTELGYLDGVTSNIQTQLNGKLSSAPVTSVNSKTGAVSLTASDVNAQPTITANGFLYGDGNGGVTAEKPVCVVTFTDIQDDGTVHSSISNNEIIEYYNNGYDIVGVSNDNSDIYQLMRCDTASYIVSFANITSEISAGSPLTLTVLVCNSGIGETAFAVQRKVINQFKDGDGFLYTQGNETIIKDPLPTVTASNNGQFLRVVNGAWAAAAVENANGVSF